MAEADLSDAEKVALAHESLAFYIGWAHRTDMPDVLGGYAVPRAHHLRIISRMEKVAAVVLREPGWADVGQERHFDENVLATAQHFHDVAVHQADEDRAGIFGKEQPIEQVLDRRVAGKDEIMAPGQDVNAHDRQ